MESVPPSQLRRSRRPREYARHNGSIACRERQPPRRKRPKTKPAAPAAESAEDEVGQQQQQDAAEAAAAETAIEASWRQRQRRADTLRRGSEERWQANLAALRAFVEENSGRYPRKATACAQQQRLATWCNSLTQFGTVISTAQVRQLEQLQSWSWGERELTSAMHRRSFTKGEKAVLKDAFSAAPSDYGAVAQSVADTLKVHYLRVLKWFDNCKFFASSPPARRNIDPALSHGFGFYCV